MYEKGKRSLNKILNNMTLDKNSMISYLNAVGSEVQEMRDVITAERKLIPDMEEISALELMGKELVKSGKDIIAVSEQLKEKYLK